MSRVFSTEEHHRNFREFIRLETAVGGPDPHLATLGKMVEGQTWEERMWRIGCYAAGYNVPTAEVIWKNWPWPTVVGDGEQFTGWIAEHWPAGFGLRRERRAVRTAQKFARCLLSYADWLTTRQLPLPDDWDMWWEELDSNLYGQGRYVLLKVAEAVARYAGGTPQQDIRAAGGKSPREGLSILYPEHSEWLLGGGDGPRNIARVEALANWLKADVENDLGVDVSHFTLQVVLCEYKKTFLGRQYPGRTHDTELRYLAEMQSYWKHETQMLEARRAVFPAVALGELQGWHGARQELEATLPEHGYLWSDLLYDYHQTTDLANPVRREAPRNGSKKNGKIRFYPIIPGKLYQRGAFDEYPLHERILALSEVGVTMVLNVSHKPPDEELMGRGLFQYHHVPFMDSGKWQSEEAAVREAVRTAVEEIRRGGVVLVHCWYGRNRSTFINALIVRELDQCSGEEALQKVRQVRGEKALSTASMAQYLRDLP